MNDIPLQTLLTRHLEDLYSAEQLLMDVLGIFTTAVNRAELRQALLHYQFQARGQLEGLEQIFHLLHMKPARAESLSLQHLIEECRGLLDEDLESPCLDVVGVNLVQRLIHYKLTVYRAAHRCAECLGYPVVAQLLQRVVAAERLMDETLDEFALKWMALIEAARYNVRVLA